MKKATKILTVFLAVTLTALIAVAPASSLTVYQAEGFRFSLINSNDANIVGYIGNDPAMVIPEKVMNRNLTAIDSDAFRDNTFITSVDFSGAVRLRSIGVYAFAGCTNLSGNVTLPARVSTIGYNAFQNCDAVTAVDLACSITTLTRWCFAECDALTNVTLPDTLQTIEPVALGYCPNLTYVNIPASVTSISDVAFYESNNVTLGVWSDSYGYQYAVANNIPYVLLDAPEPEPEPIPYLIGDATGDGYVNVRDVTAIQRHVAEFTLLTGVRFAAADVNGDSIVSVDDATALQRFLAEFDVPYPIGEEGSYLPQES